MQIIFHSSCFLQMISSWHSCWYLHYTTFILSLCQGACPKWDYLQRVLWLYCLLLQWLCFLWIVHVAQSCCKPGAAHSSQQSTKLSLPSHPTSDWILLHCKTLALSYCWLLLKTSLISNTTTNSTFSPLSLLLSLMKPAQSDVVLYRGRQDSTKQTCMDIRSSLTMAAQSSIQVLLHGWETGKIGQGGMRNFIASRIQIYSLRVQLFFFLSTGLCNFSLFCV